MLCGTSSRENEYKACSWPLPRGPEAFIWAPRKTKAKSPNEWMVCGICQAWELCYELEHGSQIESCTQWLSQGLAIPGGWRACWWTGKSHLSSCIVYPDALSGMLSEPLGTAGQQSFHCASKVPEYSRRQGEWEHSRRGGNTGCQSSPVWPQAGLLT